MSGIPNSFYYKLSGICFVIGGCMEGFMYATGFYGVNRDKLGEADLQRLLKQEAAHAAARVGQAPNAAAGGPAGDEPTVPKGLLEELKSLGTSKPSKPRGDELPGLGPGVARKAPLIEELDA
ncbi:hypothetical protein TSOC_011145 [Tetrabaena socialis]|uniref:Uncharacterized protein n=1 Tax=Tetrabaena socialis TaxID=47790 RepID=A0A2J7ZRG3_9CHLO|nr:hypothetical protein TSOC_011145 [Tetrabaena socialis]|eukprot:PNH02854.1 hypothetical protein TSOC_011145 [Tetrabaena socialis]